MLALAAAAGLAALGLTATPVQAQDADIEEQQGPQPSAELLQLVEDFYFTATVARYDVAKNFGEQIRDSNPEPEALLEAFRTVHSERRDALTGLEERLNLFQNRPEIGEVTGELVDIINKGRQDRATRLNFLQEQVERLGNGGIAYRNGIANLRQSGEYAAPVMLSYLQDPNRADLHPSIRRAMVDLGLPMVSPLLAATQASDPTIKAEVILILGDLGYPEAIPYILEQEEADGGGGQVAKAANVALGSLGARPGSDAATEYLSLAEKFWNRQSAITPDDRFDGANIWRWENGNLVATNVPAPIFDELMVMQTAGKTLALGEQGGVAAGPQDDALALWLAANYRREVELPEGASDRTRPADDPSAGYYGTQAGVDYLQAVLARVLEDRTLPPDSRYDTAAVATAAVRSLRQVIGESSFGAGGSPLTRTMQFPDQRVAIEAAMAIAQALPTVAVNNGEQVVPLLAESLVRDGRPTVLLVMSEEAELNSVAEDLTSAGYRVEPTTNATDAVARGSRLAGVDVIVVDEKLSSGAIDGMLSKVRGTPRLAGAAKLFITGTPQSRFESLKQDDSTVATTTSRSGDQLVEAVASARDQIGGLPTDEAAALDLAQQAGELLADIGLGASVFSLETGRETLLSALDDARPEIRQMSAKLVSMLDGADPQQALVSLGIDDRADDETRIAAFEGLSASAKRIGNQLDGADIDRLLQAASTSESLDVRSAAAEAVGALSLPVDQAKQLIIRDTAAK